eukprot:TRINITY_DN4054_c0_g1_i2.p1 TRINITY_DN4054_c0_g1~~TRINITY_DN4054_c0_g1_i2.p1  ORF type:complete len:452 (-),score=128.68 TRINITY_DN4054_c0_g1_i2:127-1482(-)
MKGITVEGEWTEELSMGNISSNPLWFKNPQFLLTVSKSCTVELELQQPANAEEPISFYVLNYDNDFFKGKPMTVMKLDNVVKLDDSALCPLFKLAGPTEPVTAKLSLKQGTYCIIPCSRAKAAGEFAEKPHLGRFKLGANCEEHPKRIALVRLPTADPWCELHIQGEWTEETSGGADIKESNWTKNPQYLLTVNKKTDLSITLHQDSFQTSIGVYVIKTEEPDRKAVWYKDEIATTAQCGFACSVGLVCPRVKPGTYIVIPCTFEGKQKGKFGMYVFSDDKKATIEPLTTTWAHQKTAKGKWRSSSSGGCVQNETFIKNPQYVLIVDTTEAASEEAQCKLLLQLTQYESKHAEGLTSIGFMVFKREEGFKGRAKQEDFSKDNLICQVEGYSQLRSVYARMTCPGKKTCWFTLIPSTFEPGVRASFRTTAYSDMPVRFETAVADEVAASIPE